MAKFKITKQDVLQTLKKRWWVILIELALLAFIIVADQLSKLRAVELYEQKGTFEFIPKLITLSYTENRGAGFGIFQDNVLALSIVTVILMAAIFIYLVVAQKQTMWLRIPLIFVVGGGVGNLIDRFKLGYVRDFVQFSFWEEFPLFNVADNFVTIGAFMLVIVLIVMLVSEGRKNQKEFENEKRARGEADAEMQVDPLDAPKNINKMLSSPNDYNFVPPNGADDVDKSEDDKK